MEQNMQRAWMVIALLAIATVAVVGVLIVQSNQPADPPPESFRVCVERMVAEGTGRGTALLKCADI